MANLYFRDESESVLRYRYCSFKARHSKGSAKARWEHEARLAMEDAMAEKRNYFDDGRTPGGHTDKMSFYRVNDNSGLNLRVLSKKTLPEINEAIKYWEDHLEQLQLQLSNPAKSVLRFQLRKLRTVKAIMQSHTSTNR